MPNYSVEFKSGKTMTVWATDKESAKAKAAAKYARKTGKRGRIRRVS